MPLVGSDSWFGRVVQRGDPALRRPFLVALCLGGVMALGLAPFGLGPLAFAALVGLLALAQTPGVSTPRRAFLIGWSAGLGYFGLGLHWIIEPFLVDPVTTGWMAPFALLGLAGGLALFWGAAFWGAAQTGGGLWRFAIALALFETLRGFVFTGFPWALLSHIWSGGVVLQWGALLGPYGLTLLTTLSAAFVLWWAQRGRGPEPFVVGCLSVLTVLFGVGFGMSHRPMPDIADAQRPLLRLVQPNAAQHEKWDPAMIPIFFNRMVDFSQAPNDEAHRPDLVIWPESALTVLLEDAEPALSYIAEAAQTQTMIGVQRKGAESGQYHNSLALMDRQGVPHQIYDKHHLVPFGEYMPFPAFWRRLGIAALAERTEFGYAPGAGAGLVILDIPDVGRALPLICYEAVFARHTRVSGDRPEFLVQLTNDAWFGAAVGPWQHLEQARMRAIEQGLPLVRVANTGISAVIDARGQIVAELGLGQAGYVDADLPGPGAPTLYARLGDGPVFAVLALLVGLGVLRKRG